MTREQAIKSTVERLFALREITRTTGFHTTRSQQTILRQLPDEVLTEVAFQLQQRENDEIEKALGGAEVAR